MDANQQSETQSTEKSPEAESNNMLFTVVGLILVMILIWVTVKGKLRDWFMK